MECWFCEKNISENEHDISLDFERYNYADRVAQSLGEQPDKIKHTLVVRRCNSCFHHHKRYNYMSLFALIPFGILAVSLLMLFTKADQLFVFISMSAALIGFGLVVWLRRRYMRINGVKAMVELEMKNEDIRAMLTNGWYRS